MHDLITVGVPVLAILFGILMNQRAVDKLEAHMNLRFNSVDARFREVEARFNSVDARFNSVDNRFTAVDGRLDRMQADLSQFYRDLGDHGARLDAIEKRNTGR